MIFCLRNKQNQQGPRAPHQDPSIDDEAIKNQYQGELGGELSWRQAVISGPQGLRLLGRLTPRPAVTYLDQRYKGVLLLFC